MTENNFDPAKRAQEILVAWFTFQRMLQFDPIINKRYDPDRLLEQCGHVLSEMGSGLHNFPEIVSGRFNHENEPAEYPRLMSFLKKECDWIYQHLKTLKVPRYLLEPWGNSNTLGCWTHFCELIAETIDEHPEYGKIVSSEISEGSYRYIIFRMAEQCGARISTTRKQETRIEFEEPKTHLPDASPRALFPNWLFSPISSDRTSTEESDGSQTIVITESDHEIVARRMREGINDAGVKIKIEYPDVGKNILIFTDPSGGDEVVAKVNLDCRVTAVTRHARMSIFDRIIPECVSFHGVNFLVSENVDNDVRQTILEQVDLGHTVEFRPDHLLSAWTENSYDPSQRANEILFWYLSLHRDLKPYSDLESTDLYCQQKDIIEHLRFFGSAMRHMGRIALGLSSKTLQPAPPDERHTELEEYCSFLYQHIQKATYPYSLHEDELKKSSQAWKHLCELIALTIGEEPDYGKAGFYKLSQDQLKQQMLYQADVRGLNVRLPGFIGRIFGREIIRIEIAPSKAERHE